ncbi:hypothetical protein HORIV_03430 [Vreelandella olivaria]|uniref:ABC transporter domain-containing protein n=1 Tax=Vreelandella olivaria TaxID=390919 RepID=A0ABM7GC51_9GAMM|nr:hypothetical protein HORIV_03430 [Halomonas olivaria]
MASITLEGLKKTYSGDVHAVKGIDLQIEDGEFVVLVGPSGCGKSTLLRMVAGLETITDGTLKIGDRVVNKLEPAERDIAMVFQNYALYPHMTVYNNLAYGLKNRGFKKTTSKSACVLPPKCSRSKSFWSANHANSLAASASVSPWAVPWCANRRRFYLMSRSPTWMPSCGCRCGWRSSSCSGG